MRGVVLTAALGVVLSGCVAPADTHHRPGVDHSTATASAPRDRLEAALTIRVGTVSPPATWLDVPVGATVTMTIDSDVSDDIVVDGQTIGSVTKGSEQTVSFVPDGPGVFDVRTGDSSLVLAQVSATD